MAYFLAPMLEIFGEVKILGDTANPKAFSLVDGGIIFKDFRMFLSVGSLADLT